MFTIDDFKTGDRIQIAVHTDLWMMGARYGEILDFTRTGKLRVKLDKMDHATLVWPEHIGEIL